MAVLKRGGASTSGPRRSIGGGVGASRAGFTNVARRGGAPRYSGPPRPTALATTVAGAQRPSLLSQR